MIAVGVHKVGKGSHDEMGLRNVKDLKLAEQPHKTLSEIRAFAKRGFKRRHLVVNDQGRVFSDKELAENDAFDEIIYYPRARSDA